MNRYILQIQNLVRGEELRKLCCSDLLWDIYIVCHSFHFCHFCYSFLILTPIVSCTLLITGAIILLSLLNILTMVSQQSFSEKLLSWLMPVEPSRLLYSFIEFGGLSCWGCCVPGLLRVNLCNYNPPQHISWILWGVRMGIALFLPW